MLNRARCMRLSDGIRAAARRLSRLLSIPAMLLFLVAFGPLGGCSHGQNEKAAVEALNQGLKREALVLHLFIGRVSSQCTPIVGLVRTPELTKVVEYQAAQKAGLINITQDGPGFWKVELINPSPKLAAVLSKAAVMICRLGFQLRPKPWLISSTCNQLQAKSQTRYLPGNGRWSRTEPSLLTTFLNRNAFSLLHI